MKDKEDWLNDPLMGIKEGTYKYRVPKNLDNESADLWRNFHFATRLKLEGADHFCRQLIGSASMPDTFGLPLFAHRQLKWYLEAFFFELMSAYNTLLQELNIIYAHDLNLPPEDVKWSAIKNKLPENLTHFMDGEWKKEWFKKICDYRNMAAHRSYLWTGAMRTGWGDKPWDYTQHEVSIYRYKLDTGEIQPEKLSACIDCLKKFVEYVYEVWNKMLEHFDCDIHE